MIEKFDNKFHQRYVGGEGIAEEAKSSPEPRHKVVVTTMEEVRDEYRKYVGDSKAELPEEILKTFLSIQRTENDRK